MGREIGAVLLGLAVRGAELCLVFLPALAEDVALRLLFGGGLRRIIVAAGELGFEPVVGGLQLTQAGTSSAASAWVKVGSRVARTSPSLTLWPILTAIERTTEVSNGWMTICKSLVTTLPLALTIMSTFATDSPTAASAISPAISHSTRRCFGAATRTLWKS